MNALILYLPHIVLMLGVVAMLPFLPRHTRKKP
jgi:hypothetical protein